MDERTGPSPGAGNLVQVPVDLAGSFGVLLGLDYGVRAPVAGMTLLLSTMLSVATISVLIALLPRL